MKDTAELLNQLQAIGAFIQRYLVIISVVVFAALCGYMLTKATSLVGADPGSGAATEQAEAVVRPKVDEKVVDTILNLEDRNVQVRTIFEKARENPFTE